MMCEWCLQKDGLEKLRPWIAVVEDVAPEVLILMCDRVCENGQFSVTVLHVCFICETHKFCNLQQHTMPEIKFCILGVTRHEAQQWCLAHAFELVELNPQDLPDEDGEVKIHGQMHYKSSS